MTQDSEKMATDMLLAAGLDRDQVKALADIGYFTAPASARHHLAYRGGLVDHSLNVTRNLLKTTGALGVEWSDADSPIIVGMLHDLCKCKCYREKRLPIVNGMPTGREEWEYVEDVRYPGHGAASVQIIRELGIAIEPDEEAAIRWHMGLFDMSGPTDRRDFLSSIEKFGAVVISTHFADWYASQVIEA